MQVKLKKCAGCGLDKVIWKQHNGGRYCAQCWNKIKPQVSLKQSPIKSSQKPISKQSPKRKKLDAAYSILRKQYMADHPQCEAALVGCKRQSEHVHHLYWGKDREQHMNDFGNVMAVCNSCHTQIHSVLSAEDAIEMGFKKQRN